MNHETWKKITIGGKTARELKAEIEKSDLLLHGRAIDALLSSFFITSDIETEVEVVLLKSKEIAYNNRRIAYAIKLGIDQGLEPCPIETSPHLLLQFPEQAPYTTVVIPSVIKTYPSGGGTERYPSVLCVKGARTHADNPYYHRRGLWCHGADDALHSSVSDEGFVAFIKPTDAYLTLKFHLGEKSKEHEAEYCYQCHCTKKLCLCNMIEKMKKQREEERKKERQREILMRPYRPSRSYSRGPFITFSTQAVADMNRILGER